MRVFFDQQANQNDLLQGIPHALQQAFVTKLVVFVRSAHVCSPELSTDPFFPETFKAGVEFEGTLRVEAGRGSVRVHGRLRPWKR